MKRKTKPKVSKTSLGEKEYWHYGDYNTQESIFSRALDHDLVYKLDEFGMEYIEKSEINGKPLDWNHQVMMEWEKPYMDRMVDELQPAGDVLEIGFGLGYSASRIQSWNPKSHTIIECHPNAIEKAEKWKSLYPDSDIRIVKGTWQETFETLGKFDEILFDDHSLKIETENDGTYDRYMFNTLAENSFYIFFDMAVKFHMNIGSKLTKYMNNPWKAIGNELVWVSNYMENKWTGRVVYNNLIDYKEITVSIPELAPENCLYGYGREVTIPIMTKIKETWQLESDEILIDASQYQRRWKIATNKDFQSEED